MPTQMSQVLGTFSILDVRCLPQSHRASRGVSDGSTAHILETALTTANTIPIWPTSTRLRKRQHILGDEHPDVVHFASAVVSVNYRSGVGAMGHSVHVSSLRLFSEDHAERRVSVHTAGLAAERGFRNGVATTKRYAGVSFAICQDLDS